MSREQELLRKIEALEDEVRMYKYDELTGLRGRHDFNREFKALFESNNNFYLILADVNGLKKANTEGGYKAGDELLLHAVSQLKQCNPSGIANMLFRYSGDEFVILFPFDREYHSIDMNCPSDTYVIATKFSKYFKTASDMFESANALLLARKELYYKQDPNNRREH